METSNAFDMLILPMTQCLALIFALPISLKLAQVLIDAIWEASQKPAAGEPRRVKHRQRRIAPLYR